MSYYEAVKEQFPTGFFSVLFNPSAYSEIYWKSEKTLCKYL